MKIVEIYIEHPVMQLNNTFTYYLKEEREILRGMRVKVDFNGQKIVGFVDNVKEVESLEEVEKKLGYTIKEIEEIIDEKPILNDELYQLGKWLSYQAAAPVISCFQAMLPAALKPISNNSSVVKEKAVKILNQELLQKYDLNLDCYSISEFKKKVGEYRYRKLKEAKEIEIISIEKKASAGSFLVNKDPYPLQPQQIQALKIIKESDKDVILLHGLTGSGKTEIYIQLVKEACLNDRQALVLVPEISLTPQMISRFKERFNDNIAIYHSGLSNSEKYQQYQMVRENRVKIVVGTRSAVFMPFSNLGIIIMDEEHDNSYKQDSLPRYNTRDVAIKRAQNHHCKVVLGSATPTLESYARAIKNVYELVELKNRIAKGLPKTILVDMNKELRKGNYIISGPLDEAIRKRLEKNEQVILLLNRRGYTPIMKCGSCGETLMCPHCDVALSYHKDEEKLVCHCCGYSQNADVDCPKCGEHKWRNYGIGTQRLAQEAERLYPEARVVRMDADSTKNKGAHQKIVDKFASGEADILIGTQMIAKGLDFPNVTLVGVFNADGPLSRTDYRCVETTFDLIVQASGRSGRGEKEGEVYIQAYDFQHYGIRLALTQNYIAFFNAEMQYRHAGKYPPYSYLISILFVSSSEEHAQIKATSANQYFRKIDDLRVLGPSKLLKKKDEYRYRLVLKSTNKEKMLEDLWKWYDQEKINRQQCNVYIDVDPYILD